MGGDLGNDELKLYDRQIRLWGREAQIKLKSAKVLIMDCDSSLTLEITKNLELCGVTHITTASAQGSEAMDETHRNGQIGLISGVTCPEDSRHLSFDGIPFVFAVSNGSLGAVSSFGSSDFAKVDGRTSKIKKELFLSKEGNEEAVPFQPTISIVGSVCAQELVKMITGQHPPIDNTFFIDTLSLRSSVRSL